MDSVPALERLLAYLRCKRQSRCTIPPLVTTTSVQEQDDDKTTTIACNCASVYTDELEDLPSVLVHKYVEFRGMSVEVLQVMQLLEQLPVTKSTGPNGIHLIILKESADVSSPPLIILF